MTGSVGLRGHAPSNSRKLWKTGDYVVQVIQQVTHNVSRCSGVCDVDDPPVKK